MLLKELEGVKGKPVLASHEATWFSVLQFGPSPTAEWKEQLHAYLDTYTAGNAKRMVEVKGAREDNKDQQGYEEVLQFSRNFSIFLIATRILTKILLRFSNLPATSLGPPRTWPLASNLGP